VAAVALEIAPTTPAAAPEAEAAQAALGQLRLLAQAAARQVPAAQAEQVKAHLRV
jgi:hypothetical protein